MEPYAPSDPEAREVEQAGCRAAHDRLVAGLVDLTDDEARAPSALPGWTVGHVLSHLARNAEAHVHMAEGIARGEVPAMYPSAQARHDGIEAGAGRPADRLVADVRASADAVHAAWAALGAGHWETGGALTRSGRLPASYLPMARWREVEIHHADLGRAFGWEDWSEGYVRADLPRLLALLAAEVDVDGLGIAEARRLAAVLAGRHGGPVSLPSILG
jgi:maleylpyruvate isomerase